MGEKEEQANTVNVRTRDNAVHGMHQLQSVVAIMRQEIDLRSQVCQFESEEGAASLAAAAAAAEAAAAADGSESAALAEPVAAA